MEAAVITKTAVHLAVAGTEVPARFQLDHITEAQSVALVDPDMY